MRAFKKIFCIDGSGAKNNRQADLKRPVYRVETDGRSVHRVSLEEGSACSFFRKQCTDALSNNYRILIAADVVIGLPRKPAHLWGNGQQNGETFLTWLDDTNTRIADTEWRDELIADTLLERTSDRPFVKVKKGTKKQIAFKRLCDEVTTGESVYCIDSGAKQVGRASLQFWFEVLMPLKTEFSDEVAVWPFDDYNDKPIVVAECYPTASQDVLKLPKKIKRKPPEVVKAIYTLRTNDLGAGVTSDELTWFHAVSSEDEYDMFTTAYAFASHSDISDLMWVPAKETFSYVHTHEGWMLGLKKTSRASNARSPKHSEGDRNTHQQEHMGPGLDLTRQGRTVAMACRRPRPDGDGEECGHLYETRPQQVFQKRCPSCQ